MKNKLSLLAVVLAALALVVSLGQPKTVGTITAKKETAFERVMRTRTLRCAYSVWPPYLMIDPNTKQISGFDHDIMEAIGKAANLKIEWKDEVGFGNFPEQLSSGKDDAFCVTVWVSAMRAQRVELTTSPDYASLYAYVREGDTRFDNTLNSLNNESATIALVDGSTQKAVADGSFPKAKQYALPGDSDGSQVLMALASGKGDVIFADEFIVHEYNSHNADKPLRRVAGAAAVRVFGNAFSVAKGEWELRDLLNAALTELQGAGIIDRILSKYEVTSGAILRAAPSYAK
ncbi:MAG: transporter substrate-binding domain-containing protein [Bdellovibrionales bacterium]|jgi:ABC-type amino acid transport substrate-binding protein